MEDKHRIEFFGGLSLRRGQSSESRFRTQKTASLLAYLACRREPQPREVLVEMLWPEASIEDGRHSLRTALSSLRRQIESASSQAGGPADGPLLQAGRILVGLRPGAFTTDRDDFESALARARHAASIEEKARHWIAAVELHRAPFLTGFYESWIVAEEARLREGFFQALRPLLRFLEQKADWPLALKYARRGVALDPLDEEAHRDLLRLLALSGARSEAARHFRELEHALRRQAGTSPTHATRELAAAIERGALGAPLAVLAPSPTPPPSPRATSAHAAPKAGPEPLFAATTTLLAVGAVQAGVEAAPRAASATRWSEEARRELRRFSAREVSTSQVEPNTAMSSGALAAAFGSASEALACALALRRLPAHAGQGAALCTGESATDGGLLARVLALLSCAHAEQIVCSEESAALLRLVGVGLGQSPEPEETPHARLIDLGLYHLRAGVAAPAERVFQVQPRGEARHFAPPRASPARGAGLPTPLNAFFGREDELTLLRCRLQGPHPNQAPGQAADSELIGDEKRAGERLLTLSGGGGSGKTRLALQLASGLSREGSWPWRGAVFFVPLADLQDASLIAEAIVQALRVPRLGHLAALDQAVQVLGDSPERATLLVLDNFEHLVEDGAATIHELLERAPGLQVLVTSRRLLGLPGEREVPLRPLPTPPIFARAERPQDVRDEPSVRLFVDRAQQSSPDFALTPRNAADVAALCRCLEGIPLAIELAAARAASLSPSRMLTMLQARLGESAALRGDVDGERFERFDFLRTRERTAPPRHRTLRATLDWSYNLLTPDLQRFLSLLWPFRGGCDAASASHVCEEPRAGEFLEALRECSLLTLEPSGGHGEPHFRMMETIREYALERGGEPEQAHALRRRHAEYFLSLADPQASGALRSDASVRLACLERVRAEHDNLRAALTWSLEHDSVLALHLACACSPFCGEHWAESELPIEEALHRSQGQEVSASYISWALDIAVAHAAHRGDFVRQSELAAWRWRVAEEIGDAHDRAWALFSLGSAEHKRGRYDLARENLGRALSTFEALGDWQGVGWTLIEIGNTVFDAGDLDEASAFFERCARSFSRSGDRDGVASAHAQLADVRLAQGDLEGARRLLDEVWSIEREIGDDRAHPWRRHQRGKLETVLGHFDLARALLEEAGRAFEKSGSKPGLLCSLLALGVLASARGDHERAVRLLSAEQTLRVSLDWPPLAHWRAARERALDAARRELGPDGFEFARDMGQMMTLQRALNEALGDGA